MKWKKLIAGVFLIPYCCDTLIIPPSKTSSIYTENMFSSIQLFYVFHQKVKLKILPVSTIQKNFPDVFLTYTKRDIFCFPGFAMKVETVILRYYNTHHFSL